MALQNEFKRLKDINLSIKDNKTLVVSLSEREAKYTWCGANIPTQTDSSGVNPNNQKCYFTDGDGYVFDEAPYFSGEVYFKFFGIVGVPTQGDTSNYSPLGYYFSEHNFKQLVSFKDVLVGMGLKPLALYATNDGDLQVFLSGKSSIATDPKIILKADADFQNVAENLQAALTTEPLQSEFKNKYSSLLYIDLRFGNKVYDKFSTTPLK